jgi:alpha-L-fucosidase
MGDYVSIADSAIPGAVRKGDWDASATINHTGGFKKFDNAWKSSNGLTFTLVDLVSKGGTYLMNVGATAEGIIPRPIPSILKSVGDWLKVNGEAIYGAGPSPFGDEFSRGNDETSPPRSAQPVSPSSITWRCTTKPGKLFVTVFQWPDGPLELNQVTNKVTGLTCFPTNRALC